MRPQRQIADEPVDAAAHRPSRPGWVCEADGDDWPCGPYRGWVWSTFSDAIARGMHMGGFFNQAVVELPDPDEPGDIHRRFFGWIREPAAAVVPRGHPPGGVL